MGLRETQASVIGFGRIEGRRAGDVMVASVLWIFRVVESRIASIQVFQAAEHPDG